MIKVSNITKPSLAAEEDLTMRNKLKTVLNADLGNVRTIYRPGNVFRVKSLDYSHKACKQLIDMGITPDMIIRIESAAPLGEPLVVKVGDYKVALRSKDLMALEVELQESQHIEKAS
jgi:ferrous iron transport protein A